MHTIPQAAKKAKRQGLPLVVAVGAAEEIAGSHGEGEAKLQQQTRHAGCLDGLARFGQNHGTDREGVAARGGQDFQLVAHVKTILQTDQVMTRRRMRTVRPQ